MFPELARDDAFRLETRRLWLRWPCAADAAAFVALAGEWDVARLTAHIPHPYAPDDAENFIRFARDGAAGGRSLHLVLTLKVGGRDLVGAIGVGAEEGGLELGYWLGRPYWGQGLTSEAVAALAQLLFRVTPAPALTALALAENAASRSVLARSGFTPAGEAPGKGRNAGRMALRFVLNREATQGRWP